MITRSSLACAVLLVLWSPLTQAGGLGSLRSRYGIGSRYDYGPYTGGHGYSYNVAYGYGLAFSSADSWRRDPLLFPVFVTSRPLLGPASTGVRGNPANPYAPYVPYAPSLEPVPALTSPEGASGSGMVTVLTPAAAEVWVEGQVLTENGAARSFQTPTLLPGQTGKYTIRARWNEGGRAIEEIQMVEVRAGTLTRVTFPTPRP